MSASLGNRELPQAGAKAFSAVLNPLEKAHHEGLSTLAHLWDRYVWLIGVEAQRDSLMSRVRILEAKNSQLLEHERENLRLRALLHYVEATKHRGVAATVIGRDPSNWFDTIDIDRGKKHGVLPNLPVVDGRAIVGQTTSASSESAKVLLLTDSTSAIDAIVQSSRAPGIVEGTGSKYLLLKYVLKDQLVEVGDRVIASGLDGVFPKGTLIGVVTEVNSQAVGLFQEIRLAPSVDNRRLENVLVLTQQAASAPEKSQEGK